MNINNYKLVIMLLVLTISAKIHAEGRGSERKSLSKSVKPQVLEILKTNEKLHGAFFSYDAKKVEAEAKNLKMAISKIKDEEIGKFLKMSQTKLLEITAKADREKNNEIYDFVSKALVHIVKTYDVGKYNAYSCPMVKKVWVQNSAVQDGVQNPYAPEMPACGTKDTKF